MIIFNSTNMFLYSFIIYGIACLIFLLIFASGKKKLATAALPIMSIAFTLHTIGLSLRIYQFHHLPLTGMYEFMALASWFGGAAYFVIWAITKNWFICFCNLFIVIVLMIIASVLPKNGNSSLVPALQSTWLYIHVTAAALSEVLFGIGFVSSLVFLLKSNIPADSNISKRLPDLSALDGITYRSIAVGYPLFTIGALFAGAIWAQRTWGSFWSWDPKETCSLLVWMIYSIYLHMRVKKLYNGLILHWVSIIGFLSALFTFMSTMFLGGLHSYK